MSERWTIARVLNWTTGFFDDKGLESPRFDAELLISDALGLDRIHLYTQFDKPLADEELSAIRGRVQRRGRREPVAYITGTRGFWTLDLKVDQRVLVPRPETELLVEKALAFLEGRTRPRVVDVGTGSGCVALALASERPDALVVAIDRSTDALSVAQANSRALELPIELRHGDLLAGLDGPFDLVVSNPPYIASAAVDRLMPDVLDYEPRLALDGGPGGLDVIRPLVEQAATRLVPDGALMLEIGFDQGAEVRALVEADPRFEQVEVHADLAGHDRVITARRAAR